MRNSILIPTDFSKNAWVALQYAAHLASHFNWDVHILHVYQSFGRMLATSEFNEAVDKHNTDNLQEELGQVENKIKSEFPNLRISSACIAGDLLETILNVAEENNVSFIVMGTKGASGIKNFVIGSNTFDIIQHSPIGVIAVPENYTEFKFQRVAVLTNFKPIEFNLMENFINRTSPAIDLSLIHVTEANKVIDENNIVFWEDEVMKKFGLNSITFRSKEMINRIDIKEPIPYIIKCLINEEEADIILISYTRKSFFKSLFSKNLVKTIANDLPVPAYFLKS